MSRNFIKAALLIALVFCATAGITGCGAVGGKGAEFSTINGFVQGTTYSITYADTTNLQPQIEALLGKFDQSLSIYNPHSTISRHNANLTSQIDSTMAVCIGLSEQFHALTDGLFDPTLGSIISAYGFGMPKNGAKKSKKLPNKKELQELRKLVGLGGYTLDTTTLLLTKKHPESRLDFNAIAQGQSVDMVAHFLEQRGIENYLVEIGGEVYCSGTSPSQRHWRIGVDKPTEGNIISGQTLSAIVELSGEGLATSGNYRKFERLENGQKVTHTIDPRTAEPATHNLLSATITAPTAAMADAVATACMVGGLEWSQEFLRKNAPQIKGLLIYSDNSEKGSENKLLHYSTLKTTGPKN